MSRSRSRSPRPVERSSPFPLMLVVPSKYLKNFEDNDIVLLIQEKSRVESVQLHSDNPDHSEAILNIYDNELHRKEEALTQFLEECEKIDQFPVVSVQICIPDQMVSLLIGKQGKTIKKLQHLTDTDIDIQQPTTGMIERLVSISGRSQQAILRGCMRIYELVTERHRSPSNETGSRYSDNYTTAMFVIDQYQARLVEDKESFASRMQDSYTVNFDITRKHCREDQRVVEIQGQLKDCKQAIHTVVEEVLSSGYGDEDNTVYMLIPSSIVNKIIGIRGMQVQEIAKKSRGAQIKILSDKESERELAYAQLSINGSLNQKTDAACIILERVEQFKSEIDSPSKRSSSPQAYDRVGDRGGERDRGYRERDRDRDFDTGSSRTQESINIIVPDELVSRLIGRNGENVKMIMQRTKTKINFFKKEENPNVPDSSNHPGRICTVEGSERNISQAVESILHDISKFENARF